MVVRYWRVFVLVFALMALGAFQLYGVFSNAGYQPTQPINFSHVMHAGVLQMECLYCHSGAEKGAHAGIPPVELCMGCHSIVQTQSPEIKKLAEYYEKGEPVPWVRVHRLPDHAYFNHQWHVQAGVACQECHGPIQSMPVVKQWDKLEMGRCMQCHRQDQYTDTINHPPTFHEAPVVGSEEMVGAEVTRERGEGPAYESALRMVEKYHGGAGLDEGAKRALVERMMEYHGDIYQHGRQAQARGKNASVECSTCHY